MRCLKDRPPAADLFGVKGRRWLTEQDLPLVERETVDSAVRQVEFLDGEIAAVELFSDPHVFGEASACAIS